MTRSARPIDPRRQRGRLAAVIGVIVLAIIGVAVVVFYAIRAGDPGGAAVAIGLALLSLPPLALFYWWLDRPEHQPRRYLLAAFTWGAVGAVLISIGLEMWAAEALDLSDEQMATFVAPIVEESAKGVFLLAVFLRARRVINGLLDGLIYAGVVALGFAFIENIVYYLASYVGGPEIPLAGTHGAAATFVVRGVISPFAHPMFTTSLGLAIGYAVMVRSVWLRVPLVIAGWGGSLALHGLWNGSISYGGEVGFVLMYLSLAAAFAGFLVLAAILRSRKLAIGRRSLSYAAQRGWIHPAELPWITWFGYQAQARRHARAEGGDAALAAMRRYQRLATELAFVHDAVMLGRGPTHGVERTQALRGEMDVLRPTLQYPPAMRPLPKPAIIGHYGWAYPVPAGQPNLAVQGASGNVY